jgi:hypothetical protein
LKVLKMQRSDKDKAITQKWTKNEKAKNLTLAREEETDMKHEHNEDRQLIHQMNMQRRKRMQSEYKKGLVEDLISKQSRASNIGKLRDEYVSLQLYKNKSV